MAPPNPTGTGPSEDAATPPLVIDGIAIADPDRILDTTQGLSRRALAEHFRLVAAFLLPQIADRPLGLLRCPAGRHRHCFFQRHAGGAAPAAIGRAPIRDRRGISDYIFIHDRTGLMALVQLGALELHPWGARIDDPDRPDRLILDFDPGDGVPFPALKPAAIEARDRLAELGLTGFLKTTGGKGLHVVVPLDRRHDWAEVKGFARGLAAAMTHESPDRYVVTAAKSARPGRIFIDALRNDRSASAIAPYSPRARAGAPVALPIGWTELAALSGADRFTVAGLPQHLASRPGDPWAAMLDLHQTITPRAFRAVGILT